MRVIVRGNVISMTLYSISEKEIRETWAVPFLLSIDTFAWL